MGGGGMLLRPVHDPLQDLNEAQRQAVLHGERPLMVLAGAGSGKTRVITRRIVRLLQDGVSPREILALTFTNKAAQEMASRVEAMGGSRVHVSTFHSACARFLRRDGHQLGYPRDYSIYDTYDRDTLIKMLMAEHGLTDTTVRPAEVGTRISRLKNRDVGPGGFIAGLSEVDRVVRILFEPYQARLRSLGAMDFDDLLLCFVELLEGFPDLRSQYQDRYRWLLVDEFQDTNLVQYKMMKLLGGSAGNVCVVGDPDQSIYRFRGAELRNILDFQEDFPDTTIIRLETNYRSTGCILAAAQGVIENNKERMEKALYTQGDFGEQLACRRFRDGEEEATEVAERVLGLLSGGTDPEEIAIFYRAHYLSRALEEAFRQMAIPYKIVGGLSFFERREIKDLIAYLKVVVNPLDDLSMERILNVPPRGIGKTTRSKFQQMARDREMSLVEAVREPEVRAAFGGKQRRGLDQLAGLFDELMCRASDVLASEALARVLEVTDYVSHATNLGDPMDITREENIQELLNDTVSYEQSHDGALAGYLQHVSLLTSADRQEFGPRVSLMTVHSAKGLEFDHVFVIGLEEGLFPHMRSIELPKDLEEERRLMYVALTRARRTVFLSHVRERLFQGQFSSQVPSRFLAEIPSECIDRQDQPWQEFLVEDDDAQDGCEPEYDIHEDTVELRAGARVVHPMFGPGQVVRVSGTGARKRVVVWFGDGVERTLLADYNQLQVVGGQS